MMHSQSPFPGLVSIIDAQGERTILGAIAKNCKKLPKRKRVRYNNIGKPKSGVQSQGNFPTPGQRLGVSSKNQALITVCLIWRLFRDRRVPWSVKLLPMFTVIYILFLPDLIPDFFLGIGQLDDLTLFLLGMKLFINLAPQDIVAEHRRGLLAQP